MKIPLVTYRFLYWLSNKVSNRRLYMSIYRKEMRDRNISFALSELDELTKVVARYDNNSIYVSSPTLRGDLIYFKIYNNPVLWKATKCARISMLDPQYVYAPDVDKRSIWILSNEEKSRLIEVFNTQTELWAKIKNEFIFQSEYENLNADFIENLQLPDYSQLPEKMLQLIHE